MLHVEIWTAVSTFIGSHQHDLGNHTKKPKVPPTELVTCNLKVVCVGSSRLTCIVTRVCRPSGHGRTYHREPQSYIDMPMVHPRDREPVAQVVRRWLNSREVLGSNPASVHSLVVVIQKT